MNVADRLDTTSSKSNIQVEVTAHSRKDWKDRVLHLAKVALPSLQIIRALNIFLLLDQCGSTIGPWI